MHGICRQYCHAGVPSKNRANGRHGPRRLHTLLECVLEDISFEASERSGETLEIDAAYVRARLGDLADDQDLSRYIL